MADIIHFPTRSRPPTGVLDWETTNVRTIVVMMMTPMSRDLNRAIRTAGYRIKEAYEDVGCFTYVFEEQKTDGAA